MKENQIKSRKNGNLSGTKAMVLTAMMMCIIMVAIFVLRIPVPFTQGYVNLSDGIIFIAVILLGRKYGTAAAALGSMMGDLIGGFAMWAPWSFVIKGIMALIVGAIVFAGQENRKWTRRIIGMTAGGVFMCMGYFVAEWIMYGNVGIAVLGIPWNAGQFVCGIVLATAVLAALERASVLKRMGLV